MLRNARPAPRVHGFPRRFGWAVDQKAHDWTSMREKIQNYVKSLNFKYRVALREAGISYLNKLGEFVGARPARRSPEFQDAAGYFLGARRRRGHDVDILRRRGAAAATTWIFSGDAAPPRPRAGYSVATSRGTAAGARRGYSEGANRTMIDGV